MSDDIDFLNSGAETASSTPKAPAASDVKDGEGPARGPAFQVVVGLIMIVALLAAAVFVGQKEAPVAAAPPVAAAAAVETPPPATTAAPAEGSATTAPPAPEMPSGPTPGNTLAAEIKEMKSQLDGLSGQLKELQGKVDAQPKPKPVPDLKPIQDKVDDLAKSVAAVVPLGDKVNNLDASVKTVEDDLTGLTAEVKKLAAPAPAAEEPSSAAAAPALSEGVDLFKAGKYKEAGEVFKKVESANPKDARVYYYEAFANALATGNWQGDPTLALARKGAELEKAGTTKATEVDAAFATLPANLKPWLAFFRTQAK
jgi:TolA-binding protein